jgi:hypothetical protein
MHYYSENCYGASPGWILKRYNKIPFPFEKFANFLLTGIKRAVTIRIYNNFKGNLPV